MSINKEDIDFKESSFFLVFKSVAFQVLLKYSSNHLVAGFLRSFPEGRHSRARAKNGSLESNRLKDP